MTVASLFQRIPGCPVCGAGVADSWGGEADQQHVKEFACGAAFERFRDTFIIRNACQYPSYEAMSLLAMEAGLTAEQAVV